jgi:predicted DNA binding CopG/RHH family protein
MLYLVNAFSKTEKEKTNDVDNFRKEKELMIANNFQKKKKNVFVRHRI